MKALSTGVGPFVADVDCLPLTSRGTIVRGTPDSNTTLAASGSTCQESDAWEHVLGHSYKQVCKSRFKSKCLNAVLSVELHTWMLNSTTGPVLPMPMQPPMMTISIMLTTSGYSISSRAALVRAPVHTSLRAAAAAAMDPNYASRQVCQPCGV